MTGARAAPVAKASRAADQARVATQAPCQLEEEAERVALVAERGAADELVVIQLVPLLP